MPQYMIELPHENEHLACLRALHAIEQYGSHFVTQASWGCRNGVHAGWLTVEVDSAEEALRLVPPAFRGEARVVEVTRFSREDLVAFVDELRTAERPRPAGTAG